MADKKAKKPTVPKTSVKKEETVKVPTKDIIKEGKVLTNIDNIQIIDF